MKLPHKITLLLLLAVTVLSSCNKDDENKPIIPGPAVGVEITYKVSASANIITQINYKMGQGTVFSGAIDADTPSQWQKIVVALYDEMPTTAFLETKCNNPTLETQTCTLSFYNGTELIATQTASIAPSTSTAVVTQLTKIIDEPRP